MENHLDGFVTSEDSSSPSGSIEMDFSIPSNVSDDISFKSQIHQSQRLVRIESDKFQSEFTPSIKENTDLKTQNSIESNNTAGTSLVRVNFNYNNLNDILKKMSETIN